MKRLHPNQAFLQASKPIRRKRYGLSGIYEETPSAVRIRNLQPREFWSMKSLPAILLIFMSQASWALVISQAGYLDQAGAAGSIWSAAVIDNLDRAERLGWIYSADEWLRMRNLRNQMVHEYVEDPLVLLSALQTGHSFVPILITSANNMLKEIEQRGWH